MPRCFMPIDQREITISRSVVNDVVKDLIKKWDMPSNMEIIHNELQGAVKLQRGVWTKCEPPVKTDYNNYVFVEFEELYVEAGRARDTVSGNNHMHIFQDKEVGFHIRPIFSNMKVNLTMRVRTRDLTALNKLRNVLKIGQTEKHLQNYHDVFYDYNINDLILYLVSTIYKKRNETFPDGRSLKDYINECFREGLSHRSNLADKVQPIMNECQKHILGICMESQPYNAVEIEEGIYEMSIPYEYYYQQPTALDVTFPLFLHNQYIGEEVLDLLDPYINVSKEKTGWVPLEYVGMFHKDALRYYRGDGGQRLVEHDEWYPEWVFPNTQTLCIFPFQVQSDDVRNVACLLDLPDEILPKIVKDYLTVFNNLQAKAPVSIISVDVYEQYGFERRLDFDIDENLNIRTHAELVPKHRNYVRVSMMRDWSVCLGESLSMLMQYPDELHQLALMLDSEVKLIKSNKIHYSDNNLVSLNGRITKESMRRWLVSLKYVNRAFKRAPDGFMRTVMMANLTARRKR